MSNDDLPTRVPVPTVLRSNPVIAVLRACTASVYDRVVDVLVENGVLSIELTMSTPGTLDYLPSLIARTGNRAQIGVGTIVGPDQARRAIDGGAHYLVTPVVDLEVIALATRSGVPVYPGGLTPTELYAAWAAGATAVKVFPAGTVGPSYGKHLRGPFPELEFLPSGGVEIEHIPAWLDAGAVAVSLGGPLIGDALSGGSLEALSGRTQRVCQLVADTRATL